MIRLKNGLLVVATAFFASSLSYSVFAEESPVVLDEVPFVMEAPLIQERDVVVNIEEENKEAPKVYSVETPKVDFERVYLEDLKENFDFGGNIKTFFSYGGIPTSNIFWAGNEFRPFYFRAKGGLDPIFNAGIIGKLNFGKTFKNNDGKNVLKISTSLEVDLKNDEFEKDEKTPWRLASAKGVFYDCFKIGYDSLFIAGAKTVMAGGIFKVNDDFSISFDIFRDLPLVDIVEGKNPRGLCRKEFVEKDNAGNDIYKYSSDFRYNGAIPGFALHGSYGFGSLGKAGLSFFGRPILLVEGEGQDKESKTLFGFGAKGNAEFHFLEKVDTLKIGFTFSMGIGDYVAKMKKATENLPRVHSGVVALPASFYFDGKKDDIKPSKILDVSADYAFKVNPVNEISVAIANLCYFDDFDRAKVITDSGIDNVNYVNDVLTLGAGYKYIACKNMDCFFNANVVYMHFKNDFEKKDDSQKWGWAFNFGVDCKL